MSQERWKYLFEIGTHLIVKMLWSWWRRKAARCWCARFGCVYDTFEHTHTFDISNSLYKSQKAHAYVINILWVIRSEGWCCCSSSTRNHTHTPTYTSASINRGQLGNACASVCSFDVFLFKSTTYTFVPQIRFSFVRSCVGALLPAHPKF